MIEYAIEEDGKRITASPDCISVPQWGINYQLWRIPRNIVLTYHMGTLYAAATPEAHTTIYREFKLTSPGFDCRALPNEKIFMFWYCKEIDNFEKDKIISWVKEIRELLRTGNFLSVTQDNAPGRMDIADFTFYFPGVTPEGKNCVIRCDYDEFIKGKFELREMSQLRFWKPAYTDKWRRRKPGMDDAEWHLLKYEE